MTKIEVVHFMQKIQAYYPTFSIEEYKINEWYDKLKRYDINDVYMKFDNHLNGEYKDKAPMLHYITRFLKTPEEKERTKLNDYTIQCNLCGEWMPLSFYDDKHYDKCLSINYLLNKMSKKGINVKYSDLSELEDYKFNKIYDQYKEDENLDEIGIQI